MPSSVGVCRLNVLVVLQVVCWCALATIVLSGHRGEAQRSVTEYRYTEPAAGSEWYRHRVHRGSQYGRQRPGPVAAAAAPKGPTRRPVRRGRLVRPMRNGRRQLDTSQFLENTNRTGRGRRHPHIYYEQYKAPNPPVGLLPYRLQPPEPVSTPCAPPDYYRMLWVDGVDFIPEPTGLWNGNALVLRYVPGREFIITHRFDPRNLVREGQGSLTFMSTKFVNAGEERVLRHAPLEGDFSVPKPDPMKAFTPEPPRIIFNFGISQFQLYMHDNPNMADLYIDEEPDLPKTNCLALRYMAVLGKGGKVDRFVFKQTPVTVFQRQDMESIRIVQVEHPDDGFAYYHMGSPITCNGKLAYILHSEPEKFTNARRVRAVSIYFLVHQMDKWAAESPYKTMEGVPWWKVNVGFIRHG